ncbi:MAG: hypothetical protein K9W44_02915 [Candidatus Lokiarchaeota archaeon]|nr:hypothetical protein [Candidatus Harpocratesius repetitus]
MSVRESLVKHLSTIIRSSKATIMALLSDENGLSIAKTGRSTDLILDSNAITSVSSAAFSSSEENWTDLGIQDQIIAFSFFEKICLITIRIQQTLLTIVHDYNLDWPLDADSIGSSIYHLRREIHNFFGSGEISESEIEEFSNNVRGAIYLSSMGTEIPFASYAPSNHQSLELNQNISAILDSIQNPIFIEYGLVNSSGLTIDARDLSPDDVELLSVDAFSANANVGFQKMVEEADSMNIGGLVSYLCVSGPDPENFYGILSNPCGKLHFKDSASGSEILLPVSFVSLFPMMYGAVPVLCEARNIAHSIIEVIGEDHITKKFINSINVIVKSKYEE